MNKLDQGGTLGMLRGFAPAVALGLLASKRVNVINGVTTMYPRLLNEPAVRGIIGLSP